MKTIVKVVDDTEISFDLYLLAIDAISSVYKEQVNPEDPNSSIFSYMILFSQGLNLKQHFKEEDRARKCRTDLFKEWSETTCNSVNKLIGDKSE